MTDDIRQRTWVFFCPKLELLSLSLSRKGITANGWWSATSIRTGKVPIIQQRRGDNTSRTGKSILGLCFQMTGLILMIRRSVSFVWFSCPTLMMKENILACITSGSIGINTCANLLIFQIIPLTCHKWRSRGCHEELVDKYSIWWHCRNWLHIVL